MIRVYDVPERVSVIAEIEMHESHPEFSPLLRVDIE